jgi:hypothetical protein
MEERTNSTLELELGVLGVLGVQTCQGQPKISNRGCNNKSEEESENRKAVGGFGGFSGGKLAMQNRDIPGIDK